MESHINPCEKSYLSPPKRTTFSRKAPCCHLRPRVQTVKSGDLKERVREGAVFTDLLSSYSKRYLQFTCTWEGAAVLSTAYTCTHTLGFQSTHTRQLSSVCTPSNRIPNNPEQQGVCDNYIGPHFHKREVFQSKSAPAKNALLYRDVEYFSSH